jgi:hypothetical protein
MPSRCREASSPFDDLVDCGRSDAFGVGMRQGEFQAAELLVSRQ